MQDLFRQSLGPMVTVSLRPIDPELGALVDPTQLEMALLNIAINARDALPDGGELIVEASRRTIEQDVELEAGSYVEIRMTDNGAGMKADVARRAFDPFYTTKGVGKGSGLGLSQVYAMTRQAGGAARIRSREGVGTTIIVLLRFAEPDVPRADDAAAGLAGSRPAGNVLVIDDDVDVRQFLDDSLQSLGYNVTAVADGAHGLSLMDSVEPDVLILDFAMPGLNGAEVASVVRRKRPTLPIVFATGYSESAAVEAAVGGSALLLKKPFLIADLETVLRLAIDGP
jgi:CheY-like chemotaxis protein/anti-sigma regulatory factor (Ser/Thr protein kinase)